MRLPAFAAVAVVTLTCASAVRATENDATVPTYHADAARSGHYVVPGLTWAHAGEMRQDGAFDGRVPGNIYAQPLYWHPAGAAGGQVIVATEDNVVAALDAVTGRTVWQRSLGPATKRSALPCGNIDPLGITGTPVIDERSGALYLDAMINRGDGPRHFVFGLSLADGAVLPGWPIDTAASLDAIGVSFDPRIQNQRGALTIVGDRLYVPYGGHYGACGKYHGSVVGFRLDRAGSLLTANSCS
jgi:PQQ-like domain